MLCLVLGRAQVSSLNPAAHSVLPPCISVLLQPHNPSSNCQLQKDEA